MTQVESVASDASNVTTAELWAAFSTACNEDDYYQSWLGLQSGIIKGVVQSLLVVARESQQFGPVASWPQGDNDPVRLSDVVERVLEERCGLLVEIPQSTHYAIAYPVFIDDSLHGVVALEVHVTVESQLQQAMEQLQWGVGWLELVVRRQQADLDQASLKRLTAAVDLLAVTLSEERFSSAAMVLTTELAESCQCERVSLGFLRGSHLKLYAVSHSAEVGKKMNLTRAIEQVMEEALLQRREVVYPPQNDDVLICREHEALSRQQAMANIVSFPLYHHNRYYGAITCERGAGQPFSERDIEFIRAVVALAGPALENKYANDRPLVVKVKNAAQYQLEQLFGAGHIGRKLATTLVLGLIIFFMNAQGEYRLTADTTLEGAIRRAIVVPFDGYIDRAPQRAGDQVEQGQLLCSLDDRDLSLEKLAMLSQHRQMARQYQEAVAKHDRAKSGIIKAQMAQTQAELDLLDSKLQRTQLCAPFQGLLVSGDLSQRLGGAVEQGEVLFEVTPLDAYRVILNVDERRIADVQPGQSGTLVLSSLPQSSYPFAIDQVTPITTAEEGRNYFRVEAHLTFVDESLRPGMEGVGKIQIDERKLISIWTRDMIEWLTLTLWNWLP